MSKHDFGELAQEYSIKQEDYIQVIHTSKYKESKKKAIELIEKGNYGLSDGDFWILKNETKTGKMQYTGLIISHNGCLKINDRLANDNRFKAECVSIDKTGYCGSLVFIYASPQQGIYEVGEVSSNNCKNSYPYAMCLKRLFDRVVLKLSKLSYSGVYSDSEAEEFVQNNTHEKPGFREPDKEDVEIFCSECNGRIWDYWNGVRLIKARELSDRSIKMHRRCLCVKCAKKAKEEYP